MATLKLVVVKSKVLTNGKHRVRVAVSHKQDTRYIVTRFEIDNLNQFKNGQVIGRTDSSVINKKLRDKLNNYQDVLDSIDPCVYSCAQLRDFLKKHTKVKMLTISQATDQHIAKLKKESTKEDYLRTKKYFITACGDLPLNMISPTTIENFDKYLSDTRKNNSTTRGIHLRQLKAFINPQINSGNIEYKINPFYGVIIPESNERELDLTIDEFKVIRDSQYKNKPFVVARDLLCLSYYLGGINLIDLLEIDFKGATTIDYVREKSSNTKRGDKRISLTIQPEAHEIIKKWIGRNGKLDFGYKYEYENFRRYVTRNIQKLALKIGINKRVVYYSARKSLVQHGFELGISLEILEYSIGQSVKKNRPIFNYVRIMRSHADAAMRTILDNLKIA